MKILLDDNHCLVVSKPCGLLVEHDAGNPAQQGLDSALAQARAWLKEKYQKPGNAFLQPVHRIDQPVSGAVLFARTSKAASRLAESFRTRNISKFYLAAVEGKLPATPAGQAVMTLRHDLRESSRKGVMEVVAHATPGSKSCDLALIAITDNIALIKLGSGRKHQIRVQLAAVGCPIMGDRKYGAKKEIPEDKTIALHSWRLIFPHPTRTELIDVTAPLPDHWEKLGVTPSRREIEAQAAAACDHWQEAVS